MSLPSGVVTFDFSDIEGGTKPWEADPEGMVSRWRSLTRSPAAASRLRSGVVFKHTGDGLGAAFDRPPLPDHLFRSPRQFSRYWKRLSPTGTVGSAVGMHGREGISELTAYLVK